MKKTAVATKEQNLLKQSTQREKVIADLHHRLVADLPAEAIIQASKKLGLFDGKGIALLKQNSDQVLREYTLYQDLRDGKNAIQRFHHIRYNTLNEGLQEAIDTMAQAFFTVLQVKETFRDGTIFAIDLLRNEEIELVDSILQSEAVPGRLFPTMVIPFKEFAMTAGSGFFVSEDMIEEFHQAIQQILHVHGNLTLLRKEEEAELAATILKVALQSP